jgi:hypothetical protein
MYVALAFCHLLPYPRCVLLARCLSVLRCSMCLCLAHLLLPSRTSAPQPG